MSPVADAVAVRRAGPADLDALDALETRAFASDRLSRRSYRRLVSAPSARVLVAEAEGALAGSLVLLLRRGTGIARIYSLAVAPERRGGGIGATLARAAEAEAAAAGARGMSLEVRADNVPAARLYDRLGDRVVRTIEGYYADGEAALRMRKAL